MEKITIHYITTKDKALDILGEYFANQKIYLTKYSLEKKAKVDYLMILEPIQIELQQYAVSKLWKRWLLNHFKETRLFVGGFAESTHSNFLNLLDLPISLRDWLRGLIPISAFALQYAGTESLPNGLKLDKYSDPWDRFLPVRGIDMTKQLGKFLDGHDEHYSFNNQLSRIRKELVDIETILNSGEQLGDDYFMKKKKKAQKEWRYLQNRWQFYGPLFKKLPFQKADKKISDIIGANGELAQFFQGWEKEPGTLQKIDEICKKIDELIKMVRESIDRNVYPENYW